MQRNKKTIIFATVFSIFVVTSVCFTNCSQGFVLLDSTGDDPLYIYAWHLQNTGQKVFSNKAGTANADMNLQQTWAQGIYGSGITIQISDSGVEDVHEDLHDNFLYSNKSKDYTTAYPYISNTAPPYAAEDNHGTSVAGLAAAVGWNGKGSRGVAPKAFITSANLLSASVPLAVTNTANLDQATSTADIVNMSYGVAYQNYIATGDEGSPGLYYEDVLRDQVTNKRNGKGTIYVKAAGNSFVERCYNLNQAINDMCVGNSNFDRENANPYQIVVAALDANGSSTEYSSPGSNLWLSSYGGMFGNDSPAMITTDRMGCSLGWAQSSVNSVLSFDKGNLGNTNCNYTATFNGTSSATPTLAGAVAMMLEANPNLTWRDVKYILAVTARSSAATGSFAHPLGTVMPSGYVWEQNWITNGAGFHFHNYYGFGAINTDAAVAKAKIYTSNLGAYHETAWFSSGAVNAAIPDFSATGASSTITINSDKVKIEGVRIKLQVNHTVKSQLGIELTSPAGTKSILVNAVNSLTNQSNYSGAELLLSNAFFGEGSTGTGSSGIWTLKVIDAQAGTTGTLVNWSIQFVGGQ